MANCICAWCKRHMDCTGEELCELCEADRDSREKPKPQDESQED